MNNIVITQGDTPTINLVALLAEDEDALILSTTDNDGIPFDLTDAIFETSIQGYLGDVVVIPNDQHTVDDENPGHFSIELTSNNTGLFQVGENKNILTNVIIGTEVLTFHGYGILAVVSNVPVH